MVPFCGDFRRRPEESVGWLPDCPLAPRCQLLFLCEVAGAEEAVLLHQFLSIGAFPGNLSRSDF